MSELCSIISLSLSLSASVSVCSWCIATVTVTIVIVVVVVVAFEAVVLARTYQFQFNSNARKVHIKMFQFTFTIDVNSDRTRMCAPSVHINSNDWNIGIYAHLNAIDLELFYDQRRTMHACMHGSYYAVCSVHWNVCIPFQCNCQRQQHQQNS